MSAVSVGVETSRIAQNSCGNSREFPTVSKKFIISLDDLIVEGYFVW